MMLDVLSLIYHEEFNMESLHGVLLIFYLAKVVNCSTVLLIFLDSVIFALNLSF